MDVGYAAPFYIPIRLDQLPYITTHGDYQYTLDRCGEGDRLEMTVMCGGELRHGYKVNESPRQAEFFTQTILDSFSPGRTFMSQLRITRFFASYAVELRDRKLVSCGRDWSNTTTLNSMAELKRAISDQFSMPRCPVEKAVAILEQLTARPFFGG